LKKNNSLKVALREVFIFEQLLMKNL